MSKTIKKNERNPNMTSICNVYMFYLIFEFLMPVFEFHVSSVISRTNEIYIEKIINNSKNQKNE
jgi:hypothetical protein